MAVAKLSDAERAKEQMESELRRKEAELQKRTGARFRLAAAAAGDDAVKMAVSHRGLGAFPRAAMVSSRKADEARTSPTAQQQVPGENDADATGSTTPAPETAAAASTIVASADAGCPPYAKNNAPPGAVAEVRSTCDTSNQHEVEDAPTDGVRSTAAGDAEQSDTDRGPPRDDDNAGSIIPRPAPAADVAHASAADAGSPPCSKDSGQLDSARQEITDPPSDELAEIQSATGGVEETDKERLVPARDTGVANNCDGDDDVAQQQQHQRPASPPPAAGNNDQLLTAST